MRIVPLHSEEGYWKAIQGRDQRAFESLFRLHYAPLTYFAHSLVKDRQAAEDIVEDVFVRLWEKAEVMSRPGSIKSYLYTAVRNASIDHMRKVKRMAAYTAEVLETGEKEERPVIHRIIEAEILRIVHQSLETLPPRCRQIFKMFYLEGKSLNEIAEELGLSLSTVKNQKGRAMELLRKKLPHFTLLLLALQVGT